jgi:hypothetical protein
VSALDLGIFCSQNSDMKDLSFMRVASCSFSATESDCSLFEKVRKGQLKIALKVKVI